MVPRAAVKGARLLQRVRKVYTKMKFTLSIESYNKKTGAIPVSTSPPETCPGSCPFMNNGCYAIEGPLRFHWLKVGTGERGVSWSEFCDMVRGLPEGQLWRHNQAGDLPGTGEDIDHIMMLGLIRSNKNRKGFTYTHKHGTHANLRIIKLANQQEFTVNLSANNQDHADLLYSLECGPVMVVLPSWEIRKELKTAQGNTIKMCPAIYKDITCNDCRWCQNSRRDFIIGVPAHGSGVVKVDKIIEQDRLRTLF